MAVLQQMRPISERLELVFPSPFYSTKPLSENTFNSVMARMGYKYLATAHGFRALFATVANEAGWRPDVIERQLAHKERNKVRAGYRRTERTQLMQCWARLSGCPQDGAVPGHAPAGKGLAASGTRDRPAAAVEAAFLCLPIKKCHFVTTQFASGLFLQKPWERGSKRSGNAGNAYVEII
ncbi:tyrosine-type recombinase/integrase [Comamonas resistens]|uniref:tyrosine-type recombinase/integrase n=1 Tax=Comamonas resistens TaxID=3046670 RepID=UPI00255B83FD|nr:tyrosine-type recombinase/integrase [Comamonas resistens]MDL5036355.1 tyrosine-type recombinase/integrase [Comamonas resistens]